MPVQAVTVGLITGMKCGAHVVRFKPSSMGYSWLSINILLSCLYWSKTLCKPTLGCFFHRLHFHQLIDHITTITTDVRALEWHTLVIKKTCKISIFELSSCLRLHICFQLLFAPYLFGVRWDLGIEVMVRVPKGRVNCCLFSFSCPSFWVINKKCILSYNLQDMRSSNCCTKHVSSYACYVWHNNITWLITVIWLHICLKYMTPAVLEALFRASRFLSPSEGDIASAYFICNYSHSHWGLLNFKM